MTILPLIERELRVRARSRAVYWTRFAVALAGILICLPALTASGGPGSVTGARMGQSAFQGLVGAAFVLCCGAGFLAVEGISRERRDGTMGLLFLTRVKAFDVLLGSFGAVGITCFCALIAFMPVLILPVLGGGVTGGEAGRTVLVLFDTLFLSLAIGLWAAARGRGWFESARTAFLLLLFFILAPVLFIQVIHAVYDARQWHGLLMEFLAGWLHGTSAGGLGLLSPFYALHRAADASYRVNPANYWFSLAGVFGISWLLLIRAGIRLRSTMREADEMLAGAAAGRREARGKGWMPKSFVLFRWEVWRARPRRGEPIEDGTDPIVWLLRQQRGIKPVIWAAVAIEVINTAWVYYGATRALGLGLWGMGLAVLIIQGVLFAWAASRFFAEARRTGELELLLTTPIGARRIVSSQWIWLKRVLAWPIVFFVLPRLIMEGVFVWHYWSSQPNATWDYAQRILSYEGMYIVNTIISLVALFWVGLWFGLHSRTQAVAILRTVLLATGIPNLINRFAGILIVPLMYLFIATTAGTFALLQNLAPPLISLCYFLWLWRWAKRRLQAELTHEGTAGGKFKEIAESVFSGKSVQVRAGGCGTSRLD